MAHQGVILCGQPGTYTLTYGMTGSEWMTRNDNKMNTYICCPLVWEKTFYVPHPRLETQNINSNGASR